RVTQVAPDPSCLTPSQRPPPPTLPLLSTEPFAHTPSTVGQACPPEPTAAGRAGVQAVTRSVRSKPKRRLRHLGQGALLAALCGVGAGLVLSTLENQPQAIERASSATQAATEVRARETKSQQRWLLPRVRVVIDESVHRITPNAEQAITQSFGASLSIAPNLPEP